MTVVLLRVGVVDVVDSDLWDEGTPAWAWRWVTSHLAARSNASGSMNGTGEDTGGAAAEGLEAVIGIGFAA